MRSAASRFDAGCEAVCLNVGLSQGRFEPVSMPVEIAALVVDVNSHLG